MGRYRWCSKMCAVVQFCTFVTSGDVFDRPYDWNQISLIIPSHFTTQMDMLKSGENNNRAANPPGYLLSDIKRRSLSSLLDRIPRKKEPCYSCLSGRALLLYSGSSLPWLFLFLRNRNIVFLCVFYKSFVAFLLLLLVQRISDVAAHRISIPVICLVPLIDPFIERNPRFVLYDYFLTCIAGWFLSRDIIPLEAPR